MTSARARAGFTFVEVIACLLVLTLGMLGGVALMLFGISRSIDAQARATGLATAMSVAIDRAPLTLTDSAWTISGNTATGYINGYFVKRVEDDGGTRLDDGSVPIGFATRVVKVDVFETSGGRLLASQTQRLIRKSP